MACCSRKLATSPGTRIEEVSGSARNGGCRTARQDSRHHRLGRWRTRRPTRERLRNAPGGLRPYITEERARHMASRDVVETCWPRATSSHHFPRTRRHQPVERRVAQEDQAGVRIINVARGGIVMRRTCEAIRSGTCRAGPGRVRKEPTTDHLVRIALIVCTPLAPPRSKPGQAGGPSPNRCC